jgi:8-oxo-dGTP pyrophosphatase MutT (NUDIX family)
MFAMTPPRAVAVVLRHDRVLVIKRHRDGRDYAVLPGGGVEPGESSSDAALRELREETTLTAEIDELLWTGDHNGRRASYFLMKDVSGEPVLAGSEAEAHCPTNSFEPAWATRDDLATWGLQPEGIRGLVAELLAPSA